MSSPDVIVVGSGIAGLALAAALAPTHRVRVLEQRPWPAAEATAQSSGMIRRLGEDPIERALAVRTAAHLASRDWPPGVFSVIGGQVALADDPTALNDAVAHLRARGVRVDDASAPTPALAGAPLLARFRVADEAVVDAIRLALVWRDEALARGATLDTDVAVLGLDTADGRVRGVVTSAGVMAAGDVVVAAGAWAAALAATHGLQRPLFPLRRSVFRIDGPEPRGEPWTWIEDRGLWVRPEASTWLVSGCDEAVDFPAWGEASTGSPPAGTEARLRQKLDLLLPAFRGFRVRESWTGLRTFAPDRRPLLGPDAALPGLHWLAGLGGYGISCAWAAAEYVAARLRDEAAPWLSARAVAPERVALSRWPIRPTGEHERAVLIPGRLPPSVFAEDGRPRWGERDESQTIV